MFDLKLTPGPCLTLRAYPHPEPRDVTDRAAEFLFDTLELDPAVTLADVFRLFERSPVLQTVFRRDYAVELMNEALKGPVPDGDDPSERLEYLELDERWFLNTHENTYQPTHRLGLTGVGFVQLADAPDYGVKAGERIRFSVSCSNVRSLLDLPIRIKSDVSVCEDDIDAHGYGQELTRVIHAGVSLGQVLHGLLFELSFHGGPEDQAELTESLRVQMAEIDLDDETQGVSHDDIFAEFDQPGIVSLFETVGTNKSCNIRRAMRAVPDADNAAAALAAQFGDTVVVREAFRGLTGHGFRKAFREARRPLS